MLRVSYFSTYRSTHRPNLQHYGHISDITNPVPVAAGNLRFSTVTFADRRIATRAHNCIHGFTLVDEPRCTSFYTNYLNQLIYHHLVPGQDSSTAKPTRLATIYDYSLKGHVIRDWLSSHPRIVVPLLVFLLGALSYAVRFATPFPRLFISNSLSRYLILSEH